MSNAEHGRTWPDLITNPPKWVIWLFLAWLIIHTLIVLFGGYIKYGDIVISRKTQEVIIHDTVVKHDTIMKYQTVYKNQKSFSTKNNNEIQPKNFEVKSNNQQGGQTAGEINNNY
jgi:hypothetical protein